MAMAAAQGGKVLSDTDVGGGQNALQMMLGQSVNRRSDTKLGSRWSGDKPRPLRRTKPHDLALYHFERDLV